MKVCYYFSIKKPKISNVLYVYNLMLKKALEPFQNEILSIAENCKYKFILIHFSNNFFQILP